MKNYCYYSKDGVSVFLHLDSRRALQNGMYPIKVRVSFRNERADFPTGKNSSKDDWGKIMTSRQLSIVYLRKDIENSFELVKKVVEELCHKGNFSLDRLRSRMKQKSIETLNDAIRARAEEYEKAGRVGTALLYTALLKSVSSYKGDRVFFEDVSSAWMKDYEASMYESGYARTTIAIRMRTLRSVFNYAIQNLNIPESAYPFGKGAYEIKEGAGRKLALTIEEIGKIAHYKSALKAREKHRDYWMFLYYCNGISVVDMCNLRYSDIVDGEIYYTRQKTIRTTKAQKEIRVAITNELQEIINKHGNIKKTGYIFPFLDGRETPLKKKYRIQHVTRAINKHMSDIAKDLGIEHISTYTARHSFATVLKRAGVSISYISESLGHSNIATTEHYLAQFEREEREKNAKFLTQF